MHSKEFDDGLRLGANNYNEEQIAETFFMVGAGVRCQMTARDYKDPLQEEYPIYFSPSVSTIIVKGMDKIKEGPKMGYFGIKPDFAEKNLNECFNINESLSFHGLKKFFESESRG